MRYVAPIPFIEKSQSLIFHKVRSTATVYISLIINKVSVLRTLKSLSNYFSINSASLWACFKIIPMNFLVKILRGKKTFKASPCGP